MLQSILTISLLVSAPVFGQQADQQATQTKSNAKVLLDNWTIMQMAGAPVGYIHTLVTETGTGESRVIKTAMRTRLKIKRLGSTVSIDQDSDTFEKSSGQLIRIDSSSLMSNQETKSQTFFEGNKARTVTELMGRKREQKITCPEGMIGPYRLQKMMVEKGFKPGTKWTAPTFVGDLQSAATFRHEVIGEEDVDLGNGKKRKLTKIIVIADKINIPAATYVDATGLPIKVVIKAAGINIVMIEATKKAALASLGAGKLSPDVFNASVLVAREFLPFSRRTTGAVLHVKAKNATVKISLPSSARQVVGKADAKGVLTVRLARIVPATGHTGVRPLKTVPSHLEDALAANTMIQSDEAEIIKIAKKAVGGETDAWLAAQKLEKWVSKNLTNKGYGVGFASALEVCRDRSGDCSEHAVLLAALCRASGIPAKVSMGVLYVGGIWGGHAWNEVWIDGKWYALDATIGLGSVDALHLTMASMAMKDGNGISEFATMASSLGNLDIRVETLEHGGKSIEVSGKVTVDGDRYLNRLWGFSCTAPDGFEHEPVSPSKRIAYCVLEVEGKNSKGKRCEFKISIFSAQPALNAKTLVKMCGGNKSNSTQLDVDGRIGTLIERKRTRGRRTLLAVIDARTAVYLVQLDHAPDAKDLALFNSFLAGFDFDLGR